MFKMILFCLTLFLSITTVNAQGVLVLNYHQVTNEKNPGETVISIDNFYNQMKFLNDNGYKTISLDHLSKIMLYTLPIQDKFIVITFDDGWKSVLNALPILEKFNMKSSFFIISNLNDGVYLSKKEIKNITTNPNFELASHTYSHPWNENDNLVTWIVDNKRNKVMKELLDSKNQLEQDYNVSINYLAWPSGRYNNALIKLAIDSGYNGLLTIENGENKPGDDILRIKRNFVDGRCNLDQFKRLLETKISSQCIN
jgi:peptidoglycan/xylan/chitin deacetylase (PgdA/CDA1 family)